MPKVSHTQYELIFLDETQDPEYYDSKSDAIREARKYRDRGFDVELIASTSTWRDQASVGHLAPIDVTDKPVRFSADEIDLKPTEQMANNAARGLELRQKYGKGGTAVGVARARDIKNRANLSPETVKRMHSFFARHEGNQAGGEDDAGYIAWMLWGGDAGKAWAARKSAQIDKMQSARFSHDIRLPKSKRRLNIDEASAALSQMGYRLGNVRYDAASSASVYKVTQPNGAVIEVPATKLTDFVYGKVKDLNMKIGTKAKFDEYWNQKYKDQATKILAEIARLIPKYESRRKEIRDAISDLQTANNLAHDALSRESTVALDKAIEYKEKADHARSAFSRLGTKAKFEKSDDYAAILMKPVTVANCGKMMKVAVEAMKYAKSVGDEDLLELAEEVGHECQATKSRASRKEAR